MNYKKLNFLQSKPASIFKLEIKPHTDNIFSNFSSYFIIINNFINMSTKLKWSQKEQQKLHQLVNSCNDKRKWVTIANKLNESFPNRQRTSKQCRQKYINHVQYREQAEQMKWSQQDQHFLFLQYLNKGSQWKLISSLLPGKSENAVKNKFYGKIRKLVRKLNNICKQRINKSNKPLRDQCIMRIIDTNEGFENLPLQLRSQSIDLKRQLIELAQKDMRQFDEWELLNQTKVVNLIKKIHKFNINSRYYCSRKRKAISMRKNEKIGQKRNQNPTTSTSQRNEKQKFPQFEPIILYQCMQNSQID